MSDFIYGLNKSGISVAKFLLKKQIKFDLWDDDISKRKKLKKIFKNHNFLKLSNKNFYKYNNIYVSPGISFKDSKFKKINKNKILKRDLNLYWNYAKKQKIIAITGTNGKSTSTKLIGDILNKNNFKTFIGGNIGIPLCDNFLSKKKYDYHVIELSSFQLEKINNFNPKISIILNLSKDHMDRYNNITEYINQKKKILNKSLNGYNLISLDDKYSQKIYQIKNIKNKISFSINNEKANIYIKNNYINDNFFYDNKKILIKKISKDLEEKINLQNILVAYICCKILKVSLKVFYEIISNFKGLPFRSQVIFKSKSLRIINNSKATNLSSTLNSIHNKKNILLILGGSAKEKNFKELIKYKNNIIKSYIFGKSSSLIYSQIYKKINSKKFKNLKLLIDDLFMDLKFLDNQITVLFAPACTSYDQYESFESRGEHFNKLIKQKILSL